ncbi:MAG: IPT/TIG domain-containing protein [Solirubrobacterales bacterium]
MARLRLFALAAAFATLGVCSGASAAPITLGQLAAPGKALNCSPTDGRDEAQTAVAAGNGYLVPTAGVLTSWSTRTELKGELGLKVFRPFAGQYLVLAADGPKTLTPALLMTFSVAIPVLPGDLIGIELPSFAGAGCYFKTALEGDVHKSRLKRVEVGGTVNFEGASTGGRLNISATLQLPPTISSISPATGSIKGGSVTIAGTDFAGVSAVTIGAAPVPFQFDSEGQITATVPPSKTLAAVPVTVTTVAGTATSVQPFVYEGCRVPKLKNKKLKR